MKFVKTKILEQYVVKVKCLNNNTVKPALKGTSK